MTDADARRVDADRQRAVDRHPFWYHTIDIGQGVVTPGWFDLRGVVDLMPWPDLQGKRCLDIGTFDGFLAFEMERQGAGEVVAVDIEDHLLWDWPPDYRARGLDRDVGFGGPAKGDGFRLAAELLGSNVEWKALSIYDLDPAEIGTFDVVVCGSLLLHLRDPLRALEAVRGVTGQYFMSSEQIELWLTVLGRGRPLFTLNGSGRDCQWFNFNSAGHWQMLYAAGFEIVDRSKPYVVAHNRHPHGTGWRVGLDRLGHRALTGTSTPGVLHRALLGRPRV
ncbi:MAG: class I SAM-dependent methyltransferase [Acidimicrobiales bacterium]